MQICSVTYQLFTRSIKIFAFSHGVRMLTLRGNESWHAIKSSKLINYKGDIMKKRSLGIVSILVCLCMAITACSGTTGEVSKKAIEDVKVEEKANENKELEAKSYDSPEVVFRYAELNPESDELTKAAQRFSELVLERTNGRVEVKVYPSGQLGSQKETIQALKLGAIDICRAAFPFLADTGVNDESLKVFGLPYLFRDEEHAWKVLRGDIGEEISNNILANSGEKMVALGFLASSPRSFFFTEKKVTQLEDMKGLKLRVSQNQLYTDMVKSFGASPTPIAYAELYSALQTGVVDGAENPLKGYANNKFYEVAKYYTFDRHNAQPYAVIMSKLSWDRLTEEEQVIFTEAMEEAGQYFEDMLKENKETYMTDLKEAGVEFFEITDHEKWIEAVQPLYEKYGEGYEELIERIVGIE